MRKNKIHKLLILIIFIVAMMSFYTISMGKANINREAKVVRDIANADYRAVGKEYNINANVLANSNFLYCVQNGVNDGTRYTVTDYITLNSYTGKAFNKNGNEIKSRASFGKQNATLANILMDESGYGSGYGRYSPNQLALYKYFLTWLNTRGKEMLKDPDVWYYDSFARAVVKNNYNASTKAQKIYNRAIHHAEDVNTSNFKQPKMVEHKLKFVNDGSWTYVGPFEFEFDGEVVEFRAINASTGEKLHNDTNYGNGFFTKSGNNMVKQSGDQIKSGKKFYIKLLKSRVSKVNKLRIRLVKERRRSQARIWFLKQGSMQRLIMADGDSEVERWRWNYDYDLAGNIKLRKIDESTGTPLSGVSFYVKNSAGKYVYQKSDGTGAFSSSKKAIVIKSNGTTTIKNLPIDTYKIIEVKNPNSGYTALLNPNPRTVKLSGGTTTVVIENRKVEINSGGMVWVDEFFGKGANDKGNNYYDSHDQLLPGVKVELKSPYFATQTTTTNSSGSFSFGKIKLYRPGYENSFAAKEDETEEEAAAREAQRIAHVRDVLSKYYVVFTYDGFKYTTVNPNVGGVSVSSKARENSGERTSLNAQFGEITGTESRARLNGYARTSRSVTKHIQYEDADLGDDVLGSEVTSEPKFTESNNLTGSTQNVYSFLSQCDPSNPSDIKYINMGLKEREKPDIAIKNDIADVKIRINGFTNTYKYSRRVTNDNEFNESGFNVGTKFSEKYVQRYTRAIYPSDVSYDPVDKSNELQVYITYKTYVMNQSNTLKMSATELVTYNDKREKMPGDTDLTAEEKQMLKSTYEYKDRNGNKRAEGEVDWVINGKYTTQTDNNYDVKYTQSISGIQMEAQSQIEITTTVKLDKDGVEKCLSTDGELLRNVVDINSYSTFDSGGSIYAGVDCDSAAGNAIPVGNEEITDDSSLKETFKSYEDDTDQAPVLKFELKNERTLNGVIFEDTTGGNNLNAGDIRQGDGEYTEGEPLIDNVSIKMIDREHKVAYYTNSTHVSPPNSSYYAKAKLIEDPMNDNVYKSDPILQNGNNNNDYTYQNANNPKGLTSTELSQWRIYKIEFVSNSNETYYTDMGAAEFNNVGTYDLKNGKYMIADFVPGNYVITYRWGDKEISNNDIRTTTYSVQNYKATIFKDKSAENNYRWYTKETPRYSDAKDNLSIRKAIDREMQTNKQDTVTTSKSINKMDSNTPLMEIPVEYNTYVTDCTQTDSGTNRLEYAIDNADFGIVERPRQRMSIKKEISNIKITYANGQVLCDGNPYTNNLPGVQRVDRNDEEDTKGETHPQDGNENGKFDLDLGFIRIEIGNELLYGSQLEITYNLNIKNESELDYSLIADGSGTQEENFYHYGTPGRDAYKVSYNSIQILDYIDNELTFKESNGYTWEEFNQLDDYLKDGHILNPEEKKQLLKSFSTILETDGIKDTVGQNPIKPREEVNVPIVLTKLLANGETLVYDNSGSIVEIGKNGGGPIRTNMEIEYKAPTISITPATGQKRIYYILGIGSLVVLTTGIILIRKKVLNK